MSAGPARSREAAIGVLRCRLAMLADGERSLCAILGERGLFCRGFRQWNDHEFHRRWKAVLGQSTHLSRSEIERLADLWQLAEQIACGATLPCDLRSARPAACAGWAEFTDAELERFCDETKGARLEEDNASSDENASRLPRAGCQIISAGNKMRSGNPGVRS